MNRIVLVIYVFRGTFFARFENLYGGDLQEAVRRYPATFAGARTFGGGAGYALLFSTRTRHDHERSGGRDAFDIRTWTFAYVFYNTPGSRTT